MNEPRWHYPTTVPALQERFIDGVPGTAMFETSRTGPITESVKFLDVNSSSYKINSC